MGLFNKKKKLKAPELNEIAVAQVSDKYSNYPSNGLTPARLATIFKEADAGDVLRQFELFEEMEEKDPHLFSQLQTRKHAVTGLDYELVPFSDDDRDKMIAEFVRAEIESLEHFEDMMLDMLDAIGKGISISEILWTYSDGKTVIETVKWRHPKRLLWDDEDTLKIVTKEAPMGLALLDNKFIIHRYKARSGHTARAGVLRVVAWMYLFKNYDIKDWVSFCEVYGMPLRLGKYSPGASEDDKLALMRALVQIGSDAAGIIPEGTTIDLMDTAKTASVNVYETLAKYCDEQVSKAVLGQTLTSDSGGGSYAQSKTHNEVRHDLTVADCKALAATLRRDLIRPLVLFNYGEDRRIPYLRFDVEETDDLKETAEIYTALTAMGLKIPSAHLYKKFGIPKPEDGEEVVGTLKQTLKPDKPALSAFKETTTKDYQADIDQLVEAMLTKTDYFDVAFDKILDTLDDAADLAALKAQFEDEAFLTQLLKNMHDDKMQEGLTKAMLYSDILGRLKEDVSPL